MVARALGDQLDDQARLLPDQVLGVLAGDLIAGREHQRDGNEHERTHAGDENAGDRETSATHHPQTCPAATTKPCRAASRNALTSISGRFLAYPVYTHTH